MSWQGPGIRFPALNRALLYEIEHRGNIVSATECNIGRHARPKSALCALVLAHGLRVNQFVHTLCQADGNPTTVASPAFQHGMQFSLARPEAYIVLGYIGLPRRVATQNGLSYLIEKFLVESAFSKGGVILLQSPDRSLVRLPTRGAILVDDICRKIGVLPYLARLLRQLVRTLPNLLLAPFFMRGNRFV